MAESLFTTTPAGGFNDGSPGITTSTTMKFAVSGTITHVRWYVVNPFNGGTWTGLVWEVTGTDAGGAGTGTLITSEVAGSTPTVDSWNTIALTSPVTVDANTLYRIGMHNDSRYCLTNSAFDGVDITNGNITAHRNGADPLGNGWAIRQGAFIVSATTTAYPTAVGTSAAYFVDVLFEPDAVAGDAIAPSGIAAGVALGEPSLADTSMLVAPSGIAAAAALGEPSLADTSMAIAPAGIAVTVAVGQPSLSPMTIAPSGIAVPVALGEPAAAQDFTIAPSGIAVPVSLGAPAVHEVVPGFAAAPSGLAIGVALGAPSLLFREAPGSWETLGSIVREARVDAERNAERERNPIDCPEHGWPLDVGPGGVKHCLFGGHVVR